MNQRCSNPNFISYKHYGRRGIRVCTRWQTFETFLADMGYPPTPQHEIDRIDTNGHYEPTNVRWATRYEQADNRRHVVRYPFQGEHLNLREISRRTGIKYSTLNWRLKCKVWSFEDAFWTPAYGKRAG